MKKIGLILMAGLVSFGAMAQGNAKEKWEKHTPEKMAEFRTDRMKDRLGLTDEQYKKVYDIHLEEAKTREAKMAERKVEHDKKVTEQRAAMQERRATANAKYADVLTAEQMEKLNTPSERGSRGNKSAVHKRGNYGSKAKMQGKRGSRNTYNSRMNSNFKKGEGTNKKGEFPAKRNFKKKSETENN